MPLSPIKSLIQLTPESSSWEDIGRRMAVRWPSSFSCHFPQKPLWPERALWAATSHRHPPPWTSRCSGRRKKQTVLGVWKFHSTGHWEVMALIWLLSLISWEMQKVPRPWCPMCHDAAWVAWESEHSCNPPTHTVLPLRPSFCTPSCPQTTLNSMQQRLFWLLP
jgi:hypothetical protein